MFHVPWVMNGTFPDTYVRNDEGFLPRLMHNLTYYSYGIPPNCKPASENSLKMKEPKMRGLSAIRVENVGLRKEGGTECDGAPELDIISKY